MLRMEKPGRSGEGGRCSPACDSGTTYCVASGCVMDWSDEILVAWAVVALSSMTDMKALTELSSAWSWRTPEAFDSGLMEVVVVTGAEKFLLCGVGGGGVGCWVGGELTPC